MNDIALPASQSLSTDYCPSGKNEFAEIVQKAGDDRKLSRNEADAIIACNYGQYLPKENSSRPQSEIAHDGHIGDYAADARSAWERQLTNAGFDLSDPVIQENLQGYEQQVLNEETVRYERTVTHTAAEDGMVFDNGQTTSPENVPLEQRPFIEDAAVYGESIGPSFHGITDATSGVAYVRTDGEKAETGGATVLHEAMHQYAHPKMHELPRFLDEGMTEYFGEKALSASGIDRKGDGMEYFMERQSAFQLGAIVGEEAMAKAYFSGDIQGLENAFDAKVGEGSWERYTGIMEQGEKNGAYASELRETVEGLEQFLGSQPGIQEDLKRGDSDYFSNGPSFYDGEPLGIDESL